jgi:hypothetical protein
MQLKTLRLHQMYDVNYMNFVAVVPLTRACLRPDDCHTYLVPHRLGLQCTCRSVTSWRVPELDQGKVVARDARDEG